MKKKNIFSIIIIFILITTITVEIGITLGYYILSRIDYNNFRLSYNVSVINK